MTQLFTRRSVADHTRQEVVALAPWPFQPWLVGVDCLFYNPTPTTTLVEPPLLHVPLDESTSSIATLPHFPPDTSALLTDLALSFEPS
jgi:hypothetical protein